MNRKEFLKMVAISPIALVINRVSGMFKFSKFMFPQKTTRYGHTWRFLLPFGTIIVHQYQWGKGKLVNYRIIHGREGEKVHKWVISPDEGLVMDTTEWRYLDMSQEDTDCYMRTGKKWIPGHFEDIVKG